MRAIAVFLMLLKCTAWGGTSPQLLIRAPDTDEKEYLAFLRLNPGFFSQEKAFEQWASNSPKRVELMRAVVEAQRAYFTENLEDAKAKMLLLDGFRHLHDWPPQDRRTLFQNLLRLAQITSDEREKESWLKQAKAFVPDFKPDPNLFPPPLVRAFEAVTIDRIKWIPGGNGDLAIFLNGKKLDFTTGRAVEISEGVHRLTLVSPTTGIETRVGKVDQITIAPSRTRPMVSGNCDQPLWLDTKSGVQNALFPGGCLAKRSEVQNQTPLVLKEEHPQVDLPHAPLANSTQVKPSLVSRIPSWVWWSLGASAAGLITWQVIENQNDRQGPSVKEGL